MKQNLFPSYSIISCFLLFASVLLVSCYEFEEPDLSTYDNRIALELKQQTQGCKPSMTARQITATFTKDSVPGVVGINVFLVNDSDTLYDFARIVFYEEDSSCTSKPRVGFSATYSEGLDLFYLDTIMHKQLCRISYQGEVCDIAFEGTFIKTEDSTTLRRVNFNEKTILITK